MNVNFLKSRYKQDEGSGSAPERTSINTDSYLNAVRVDGEVLVLRCWVCGTAHYVNAEQCTPEELPLMICSKSHCMMSLFLVNELAVDEQATGQTDATEPSELIAAFSRLWK
jgi:hypothetical protein